MGDAAKAAAQHGYELELEQLELESPDTEKAAYRETADEIPDIEREPDSQRSSLEAAPPPPSAGYQTYRSERVVEEEKGGGRLRGCFIWVVSLVGIGVVVLVVLFSLDVVSPRAQSVSLGLSRDPDARADCGGRRPVPR